MSLFKKKQRICYYSQLTDDVVISTKQNFTLPSNYQILPVTLGKRCWNKIIRAMAFIFAWPYSRLFLHVKVIGREKLKAVKGGYFVYGNHTQPVGDVFTPLTIFSCWRFYALAAQANWGIPLIGKYLVRYGGLPVGQSKQQILKLLQAIKTVMTQKKCIIMIYPEAHVWPYYTKIRPFSAVSMHFPILCQAPCFTLTTTYHRSKFHVKPKIIIYVDGPFYPDPSLNKKAAKLKLHQQILAQLQNRAKLSNYNYIDYRQKNKSWE